MKNQIKMTFLNKAILSSLAVLSVTYSTTQAAAVSPEDAARQAEQHIQREQQRFLDEQQEVQPALPPSGMDLEVPEIKKAAEDSSATCRQIDTLIFKGATLLDEQDTNEMKKGFEGECLTTSDVGRLLGALNRHYTTRGYITSRMYLPSQDLSKGTLTMLVIEGIIEELKVEGDPKGRVNLKNTLPAKVGDLLNIRDLEQAVDQINSIAANRVKLDIRPGSRPGSSIVVFKNTTSKPYNLSFSADSHGSEGTGENSISSTLTLGGLIGWNETLSFTARSSVPHSAEGSSDSLSLTASIPSGYSNYKLSALRSNFSLAIGDTDTPPIFTGVSDKITLGFDHLVYRNQSARHKVNANFEFNQNENFIDDQLVGVSSSSSRSFMAGTYSSISLKGGLLVIKPSIKIGLRKLDNLTDDYNLGSDGPQSEFTKLNIDIDYSHPYKWGGQHWTWNSNFHSQQSSDGLFGSDKISIGGISSVRGFSNTSIGADSGYHWRNELSLSQALDKVTPGLRVTYMAGLDFGHVRSNTDAGSSGTLAGAALGATLNWRTLSANVIYTTPVSEPEELEPDEARVWLRLSASL